MSLKDWAETGSSHWSATKYQFICGSQHYWRVVHIWTVSLLAASLYNPIISQWTCDCVWKLFKIVYYSFGSTRKPLTVTQWDDWQFQDIWQPWTHYLCKGEILALKAPQGTSSRKYWLLSFHRTHFSPLTLYFVWLFSSCSDNYEWCTCIAV